MTWITDDTGRRWVDVTKVKKLRNAPRPLKFGNVKVGDQLMKKPREEWYRKIPIYYVVTDRWFDPVEGQRDPIKGEMVGYAQIKEDGSHSTKSATTVRGLASQQFDFADVDYIALATTRAAEHAKDDSNVVGIGLAKVIRSRPKISGL